MKILSGFSSTIHSLTQVVIALLGLGIVVSLLGGNVPFVSGIADNIVGLVQSLGDAGIVGLVAAMIWTFLVSNTLEAVIYGGMLGFSSGFLMTVNSVIWPNYYGRQHLGSIRGIATTVTIAAAALGPLPFAFLTELMDSYGKAVMVFLLLPVLCIVASALAVKPVFAKGVAVKSGVELEV